MRRLLIASIALAALVAAPVLAQDDTVSASIENAIADEARPEADRQLDANRHPAEVLLFAGVEPGWRVADLVPGGGYYSRVLSTAVGPEGHVYAYNASWVAERFAESNERLGVLADEIGNMTRIVAPLHEINTQTGEPLDAIFMVLFYHDTVYHDADRAPMNQAMFDRLRPGGVLILIDHAAVDGSGADAAQTLHRIDREYVVQEVTAAGFELDGDSDMLANPEDTREISPFDPSIRRQTDRFVLRFRKPE